MELPKGFRPMTPDQWKHYFYLIRWCIQYDLSDEQMLNFSKLTPEELADFKKEVIDSFGDERGTKGSYRHVKFYGQPSSDDKASS